MKNFILSFVFQDKTTADAIGIAHEIAKFAAETVHQQILDVELKQPGKSGYIVFSNGEVGIKKEIKQ